MDGMEDPSMVILSDPSTEDQVSEDSPEYLRGRLEAAERATQERDVELQRHQQALQAVLLQQQEFARQQQAQQSYQEYQRSAPQQQQPTTSQDPWEAYMAQIGGGSTVDSTGGQQQQQRQLTVEEAASMADQIAQKRINETLNAINQDTQVGNALAQRFQTQDSDLLPYSDVVASYFAANQHLPKAQAYEIAVNTTRNMLRAGRLAPPAAPQSPYGGQWRTNAQQSAPGTTVRRIDDTLRKEELTAWTDQRKNQFEKRRMAQY